MVEEIIHRISVDPDTKEKFCQSFGLDPKSLPHPKVLWHIREFFPDTPIKLLKDTFEALQLYDLVDFLEKALKPRALRPALPLKEIEKLAIARNRPTTRYSKIAVLMVDERDSDDTGEKIENFFKLLNPRNEVTVINAKPLVEINKILEQEMLIEQHIKSRVNQLRAMLAREREQAQMGQRNPNVDRTTRESSFRETEGVTELEFRLGKELEGLVGRRGQMTSNAMTIKREKEELQKAKEKLEVQLSTTLNKWKRSKGWLKLKLISYVISDSFWILRHFSVYAQIFQVYC